MNKVEAFAYGLAAATAVDTAVLAFDVVGVKAQTAIACDFAAAAGALAAPVEECDQSTLEVATNEMEDHKLFYGGVELALTAVIGGGLRMATRPRRRLISKYGIGSPTSY